MEVFSVFATLSLKDLLSGPLAHIGQGMRNFENGVASLGQRMGSLALAMAPLAIGAGAVLGAFGKCVSTAAGFEDQMAKVGAVSRASAEDLAALEAKARELGGTTQFTAVQVGEAEQYLAMAGFSAKDNIAALPGVLNLAAATATDLGRAADISSDILGAFGLKAAEMGRVADVLAMTCSTANTDMEKLGETMKYVAPVARTAGMSIEETAAMAGLLGNVGIKGSQAGTTLKAMLNKLAAPASEGSKALKKLGIATKDAAGNLRSPIQILGEMSGKLKTLGTAEQMAAMKAVVGEEAVAGFAELIKQGGIGELEKYIKVLNESGGACDKMAGQMNDTLAGSLRGMGSAWESLQISIGKIFLPVARKVVDVFTGILRLFDKFSQSKIGQSILKVAGALATAVVAITAFSAGMWAFAKLAPMISSVFGTLKAGLLGLGAPVWALIAVAGILYLAWTNNFGGMAATISRWGKNVKLIFDGVCAVFNSLKGSSGEIRGELAKEIKANGLVGLVTTVGKIIFRIKSMFQGFWNALQQSFHRVGGLLIPVRMAVADLMNSLKSLFSSFGGGEVKSAVSTWEQFGVTLGKIAGGVLEGAARALSWLVEGIRFLGGILGHVIGFVSALCSSLFSLTGATSAANDAADPTSWGALGRMLGVVLAAVIGVKVAFLAWRGVMVAVSAATKAFAAAQWLLNAAMTANPIGIVIALCVALAAAAGWIISNWETVKGWWNGLWSGISTTVTNAWNSVTAFLASINPIGLISQAFSGLTEFFANLNFVDGIQQAWNRVVEFFAGLNLFESGARLIETLKEGVLSAASSLIDGVKGVFSSVRNLLPFSDAKEGPLSELTLSGSRIMTTLGEGVGQGKAALKDSVHNALGEVNSDLQGWQQGLSPLEMAAANQAADPLPSEAALPMTEPVEALPELVAQAQFLQPDLPEMPQIPANIATPDIPAMPEPAPLAMSVSPPETLPQIGDLPPVPTPDPVSFAVNPVLAENMNIPALDSPEMPDLSSALKPVEIPSKMMRPELASMTGFPAVALDYGELPPAPEAMEIGFGALPDVAAPEIGMPEMPSPPPLAMDVSALKAFQQPLPEPELPQIPSELTLKSPVLPELPSLGIDAPVYPDLPTLGLETPEMPEMKAIEFGQLPNLPDLEMKVMPAEMGAIPEVNPPEIPQPKVPEVAIPEPPIGFPQDNAMRAETGQTQNTQHISITIGQITLPDVKDAESFLSSLKGALQNEIGQFEGATA